MSDRILVGALAVALVFFALVAESGGGKLGPARTADLLARDYGAGTRATCQKTSSSWDYRCRIRRAARAFVVDVKVDHREIISTSGRWPRRGLASLTGGCPAH